MIRRNAYLALALSSLLAAVPALTVPVQAAPPPATGVGTGDRNNDLASCADKAERRPEEGFQAALRWQETGGGDLARLCQALALFYKGDFAAAATALEVLAPVLGKDDPKAAASILGRGGWAWLRAGDQARAERLYSAALEKQPDDVDLLIDRAFARAEAERFWDAIADLDAALAKDPKRSDAYLYRATAHKALSNYRQALSDIDRVLELKPGDPEAILLRGNVKALAGSLAAARDDWSLVQKLAPDSDSGRAAAMNLDRMAKVEVIPPKAAKPGETKPAESKPADAKPAATPKQ